jgi:hypothetical protein
MIMLFLDQNFMFFPMVQLSFCCQSNSMYRKINTTIHWICACINLHYLQHIGLNLQENKVHHSKERKILVQKQHYYFAFKISLYLYMISALKDMEIYIYGPGRIYAYRFQTNLNTYPFDLSISESYLCTIESFKKFDERSPRYTVYSFIVFFNWFV